MDLWFCRLRTIEEMGHRIKEILRSAECGLRIEKIKNLQFEI
jgi:hypothetical protein